MKIIMITPYPPQIGGVSQSTKHLVKSLRKINVKVKIISFQDAKGENVFPILSNKYESYKKAKQILEDEKPDLVHIQFDWGFYGFEDYCAPLWIIISKIKELQVPLVTTLHNSMEIYNQGMRLFKKSQRILPSKLFFNLLLQSSAFIVHTEKHKKKISSKNVKKILLALKENKKIKDAKQKLGLQNNIVFLMHGFLHPAKGFEEIIKIWPQITKKYPAAKLIILGGIQKNRRLKERIDYQRKLTELVENSKAKKDIQINFEVLNDKKLALYYSVADFGILPYKLTTQSGVLNDFFGYGVPTIVKNKPGLEEYVLEAKGGLVYKNKKEFVQAIFLVLEDKILVNKFKKSIKRFVKKYSYDKCAKQTLSFYKQLIKNNSD